MKRIRQLRAAEDFRTVFRRGRSIHSPLFRILLKKNTLSHARLAIVTPRAIEKRSVLRNTLRRRIREWLRTRSHLSAQSSDVVIVCKKESIIASRKVLYEELENIFKKIF